MKRKKLFILCSVATLACLSGCKPVEKFADRWSDWFDTLDKPDVIKKYSTECYGKHDFSDWTFDFYPSCISEGRKSRKCKNCGFEEEEILNKTPDTHRWYKDYDSDQPATCQSPAIVNSLICADCGLKKAGITVDDQLGAHSYETLPTNVPGSNYCEPTCTEPGYVGEKCKICGYIHEYEKPAHGHDYFEAVQKFENVIVYKCGYCSLKNYCFPITEAEGWKDSTVPMSNRTGEGSVATWDIPKIIPEGKYDVFLNAQLVNGYDSNRPYYNLTNTELNAEGDIEKNEDTEHHGSKDLESDSPFRYYLSIDSEEFVPTTKKTWGELGAKRYFSTPIEFVNSIEITNNSSKISLVHGDIGHALYVYGISLFPHVENN